METVTTFILSKTAEIPWTYNQEGGIRKPNPHGKARKIGEDSESLT